MRTEVTFVRPIAWTLAVAAALPTMLACASDADSKRPAPPGGGVDPATITADDLSMGEDRAAPERVESSAAETAMPAAPAPGGSDTAKSSDPTASATASQKAGAPAAGSFKMTAEHCKEAGRKFSQLAIEAGLPKPEAKKMSDDVVGKCLREDVGQMQDKKSYDCVLAAKTLKEITTCKR